MPNGPWSGTSQSASPIQSAIAMKELSKGRTRWPIISTIASTYAATIQLQLSDGLNPFDRKLVQALALALAGVALMALAERLLHGPARFAACAALWAITSWLTLRYGLTRQDRLALGGLSRRLRLV